MDNNNQGVHLNKISETGSLKEAVLTQILNFSELTASLFESVAQQATGRDRAATFRSPENVLEELLDADRLLQQELRKLQQHQRIFQKWSDAQAELAEKQASLREVAATLRESELELKEVYEEASRAVFNWKRAKKGAVSPDVLVNYGHLVSHTVTAPPNWRPEIPSPFHPPAPQDHELRQSILHDPKINVDPRLRLLPQKMRPTAHDQFTPPAPPPAAAGPPKAPTPTLHTPTLPSSATDVISRSSIAVPQGEMDLDLDLDLDLDMDSGSD